MSVAKRTIFFLFYYSIGFFGLYFLLQACMFRLCSPGSVDLLSGQSFFFPHTRQVILFYTALVPALFFYFLHALYTLKKKMQAPVEIYNPAGKLAVLLFLNGIVIVGTQSPQISLLIPATLWLISFFSVHHWLIRQHLSNCDRARSLPGGRHSFSLFFSKMISRFKERYISFEKQLVMLFLIILCGGLVWAFSPFVFSTPKLINDFLDIPETTLIDSPSGIIEVDNDAVIEKLHLFGSAFQPGIFGKQKALPKLRERISPSLDIKSFEKRNLLELNWQFLTRGFIHHHNHVLAPINDLALGRPLNEVFSQYGWGWVYFMKTVMEHVPNGICYGNYIRLHFLGYYFYYAFFLILLFYLFKDIRVVTVLFAVSVISVLAMDQYVWLGPGFSPMRHFFDIPVILFFIKHLTSRHFRYLYATLLFCILSVIFNTQFGAILFLSILAGQVFLLFWTADSIGVAYKKRLTLALVAGTAVFLGTVWFCSRIGAKDIISGYFFEGVQGFPIKESQLMLLGAMIITEYLAWICIPKNVPLANRIISLVLLWYTQMMLLYYVRSAVPWLFLPIFPLIALAIGYLVVQLANKMSQRAISKCTHLFSITIILLAYGFISSAESYHNEFRKLFVRNFAQHVTYKWDMPRTHFISTMDPRYFASSIALIQKYSPDKKGIYIISKYDRFLPFISERYSAMPLIDLEWILITQKELDLVVSCIQEKMPEYLFVDTDIDRDFLQTQVIAPDSRYAGLCEESLWRAQRLNNLKTVFDAVRGDYEKIETAGLLTVYRRKSLPETQEAAPHARK